MALPKDKTYMEHALAIGRQGIDAGQTPFGACITRGDSILTTAHNDVRGETDITAHAEICALRKACRLVHDIDLSGATIYSTTEPCPMCFAAIHWARIDRIVFGARIADAARYGFNELLLTNQWLRQQADLSIEIVPDLMRDEALGLFEYWQSSGGKPY